MPPKCDDNCVQNVLNTRELLSSITAVIILIDSFQPTNIIVGMCDQMNIKFFRIHFWTWLNKQKKAIKNA